MRRRAPYTMDMKIAAVVIVAVIAVCAASAIVLTKGGGGNDDNKETDFGLLQEDKLCPGVVAECHIRLFHEAIDSSGVIVDMDDDLYLADFQLERGEYKSWMHSDLFYGFGLLGEDYFTFPEGTTTSEVKHMGVKMTLYEFKGHLTGPSIDYDFTDGQIYAYGGYIWEGSGHFINPDTGVAVDFSCSSNIYKDEGQIDYGGQPDMSLLDDDKIGPGLNADTPWFKGNEDHLAEFYVSSVIEDHVYGRFAVDGEPVTDAPTVDRFFDFALMASDGSEFVGATVSTESFLDVDMTVYSFDKGTVKTKFFEQDLENAKVYIYKGYIWRISGTASDTGEKFYCVSGLFMSGRPDRKPFMGNVPADFCRGPLPSR